MGRQPPWHTWTGGPPTKIRALGSPDLCGRVAGTAPQTFLLLHHRITDLPLQPMVIRCPELSTFAAMMMMMIYTFPILRSAVCLDQNTWRSHVLQQKLPHPIFPCAVLVTC
jgi:hypothetical protein